MTFEYIEPASLDEAIGELSRGDGDTIALAGGTAFSVLYGQGLIQPGRVIGLRRLDALRELSTIGGSLRIGALVTHRAIERSSIVMGHHPVLSETFARIATIRIRNQATIGGNLAHADPAQDPPPTLIILDSVAIVASARGTREVAVGDLFTDYLTTALEPDELITEIVVPPVPRDLRAVYVKYQPRSADDYATVSVAAAVRVQDDGTVSDVRVALGAVGATPIRARGVESALIGTRPTEATLAEAAAVVRDEVSPIDDTRGRAAYKSEMARVWVHRALRGLVADGGVPPGPR